MFSTVLELPRNITWWIMTFTKILHKPGLVLVISSFFQDFFLSTKPCIDVWKISPNTSGFLDFQ